MPKKAASASSQSAADKSGDPVPGKSTKKKSTSKASKAGLFFPVPKINKRMQKAGWTDRVGGTAPIWVAAVCEYMGREIIEAAGKTCSEGGKHKRITPRDVILAIRNDSDLHRVFAGHKTLVGDKLKGVADEMTLDQDKRYKEAAKKAALEGAEGEEEDAEA